MTETALRAVITRMATDAEFARTVREAPERVAAEFDLTAEDMATLSTMTVDGATRRPQRLEERLSRSALIFGGEFHTSDTGGDSGSGDTGGDSGSSDSGSSDSGGDSGSDSSDSGSNDSGSSDSGDSDSGDSDSGDSDSGDSGSDHTSDSGSDDAGSSETTHHDSESTTPESRSATTTSTTDSTTESTTARGTESAGSAPPDTDTASAPATHSVPDSSEPAQPTVPATPAASDLGPVATVPVTTLNATAAPEAHHEGGAGTDHPFVRPDVPPAVATAVAGSATNYHGGVVGQQVNGTTVTYTYGDGTSATAARSTDAAGRVTDTVTRADGSTWTHTYDPAAGPATGTWQTTAPDGTATTFTGADARGHETRPDGTVVDLQVTTPTAANDQTLFILTEARPGAGPTTVTVHGLTGYPDQAWVAVQGPDGAMTQQAGLHQTDNPDGSRTTTILYRDGDTDSFTTLDGHVVDHQSVRHDGTVLVDLSVPDPARVLPEPVEAAVVAGAANDHGRVVAHSDPTENVDGSTTTRLTYADGTTAELTRHTDIPNTRWHDVTVAPDGTEITQHWHLDSNRVLVADETVTTHPDGAVTTLTYAQPRDFYLATFTETTTHPDGSSTVFTGYKGYTTPDDHTPGGTMLARSVDTDAAGRVTTTTYGTPPGGSLSAIVEGPDGSRTVTPIWFDSRTLGGDAGSPNADYAYTFVRPDGGTETVVLGPEAHRAFDSYDAVEVRHWTTAPADATADPGGLPTDGTPVTETAPVTHPYLPQDPEARVSITRDADGTETSTVEGHGLTEVRTVHPDGTGTRQDIDPDPYEDRGGPSVVATWTIQRQPDGSWLETKDVPTDAERVQVLYAPDGAAREIHLPSAGEHYAVGPVPVTTTYPDGLVETYTGGHLTSTTFPHADGGWTSLVTGADGHTRGESYSGNGTLQWTSDATSTDTSYYDPAGRLVGGTFGGGTGQWGAVPADTTPPPTPHSFDGLARTDPDVAAGWHSSAGWNHDGSWYEAVRTTDPAGGTVLTTTVHEVNGAYAETVTTTTGVTTTYYGPDGRALGGTYADDVLGYGGWGARPDSAPDSAADSGTTNTGPHLHALTLDRTLADLDEHLDRAATELGTAPAATTAGAAAAAVITTATIPASVPTVDPNAGYHGGVVRTSAPTPNADGSTTVQVRYGDGTSVEVHRVAPPTGGITDTWTEPDGTTVTHTYDASGERADVTSRTTPDGTQHVDTRHGDQFSARTTRPDGSTSQTGWRPDTGTFSTVDEHGGGRVETVVTPTSTGGYAATITSSDGAVEHVRLSVTSVDNPDGSTTRIFAFPDGDTDAFTLDPEGTVIHHEARHADGTAESYPSTTPATTTPTASPEAVVPSTTVADGADGHRVETTVGPDGVRTVTDTAPDGSWTRTSDDGQGNTTEAAREVDGTTHSDYRHADGSWGSRWVNADGSVTDMVGAADGTVTQTNTDADGFWFRSVTHPDGTRTESAGDPQTPDDGTTVEVDAAGGQVTHLADGTTIVLHTRPDGSVLDRVTTAPDGTVTTYTPGASGSTTVVSFDTPEHWGEFTYVGMRTVQHGDGTQTVTWFRDVGGGAQIEVTGDQVWYGTSPGDPDPTQPAVPSTPVLSDVLVSQEDHTLHHGQLQVFHYDDGHVEIFAAWEDPAKPVVERTFATEAEWHMTKLDEYSYVERTGMNPDTYRVTFWADGRYERIRTHKGYEFIE